MPAKKKTDKQEPEIKEPEVKAPTTEDTDRFKRKKTKEELQEEIDKTVKDLEQEIQEDALEEDEENTEDTEESQEEEEVETKEPNGEDKPDYRKRYEDSSREAHILYSKNKKMTEAIERASDVPEPTEEELQKEFPEWDEMSNFEQRMAKDSVINKRKLDAISEVAKDFKDMDAWNQKVDEFITDVETITNHPALEGREEEFKIFVSKETRRGVDFETLTSAFLYEVEEKAPPKKRGKMFETGSAGLNEKTKPKSDKVSLADATRLRQTNYKEYVRLLREKKIDIESI